jgi:hypothetical protein
MANDLSANKIMQALNWTYHQAINGVAGFDSAEDMANDYLKGTGSLHDKANSLIRWQNTKAATSGFLTGLSGVLVMPITIPAGMASVMYVQIRMIAAIAKMGGYDLQDDKVKTLVFACLTGDAAKDVLKEVGIVVGSKMATRRLKIFQAKPSPQLIKKWASDSLPNLVKKARLI